MSCDTTETQQKLDVITHQLVHLCNEFCRYKEDELIQHNKRRRQEHPNPISRCGSQLFSQSDEDGVTIEILRRLGVDGGSYLEVGVGPGTQCNSLVLAAMGWSGVWVDIGDLCFEIPNSERLHYIKQRVDAENVKDVANLGLSKLKADRYDVISIDIDGLDYYLCEKLLTSHETRPRLFIVEYNADFPPPVEFVQPYRKDHQWDNTNFYGASLQSMSNLFSKHGYTVAACNAGSGCNVFFIEDLDDPKFSDVPTDLKDLYVDPHYLLATKFGHTGSVNTVRHVLK